MNDMLTQQLIGLIKKDPWRMDILRCVRSLDLLDACVGAGFVRNIVWDYLHGHVVSTSPSDIDVIYFDRDHSEEKIEKEVEERLKKMRKEDWSVKNQARFGYINHQGRNYTSVGDALAHWPETATAIAVRLRQDDTLEVIAPYGLDDLFSLIVRISPNFGDGRDYFLSRISKKGWKEKWPKLIIV